MYGLLLHTGDLTHLSDPAQFDTLGQVLQECRTKDVFYVPGEHDIYDNGALKVGFEHGSLKTSNTARALAPPTGTS
jgi:hypothetical protein